MAFAYYYNVKYYESNSLLIMDNIPLSFDYVDLEKLDYSGIKLLSMPIDRSDI